jgi:hypothetical protein
METDRLDELERRVAALEVELAAWRSRTRQILEKRYGVREPGAAPGASATQDSLKKLAEVVTGEGAIGRIGIGLLLLGLVFAVKYGIDRGWITELVQVVIAATLGLALLAVGYRIRPARPILSRLLTGGGFGALYVAVFAAQAVYELIPFGPALALVSLVTAACFLVGTSRDDAAMAIVAVLGGLSTPFVIRSGDPDLPALVAYVSVVLALAGLLYWRHGWRSLPLWTAAAAIPVIVMVLVYLHEPEPIPLAWRWSAQALLLVVAAVFTAAPIARPSVAGLRPEPGPPDWLAPRFARVLLPALAVFVGLAAWFMERAVWELSDVTWAGVGAGVAIVLALAHEAVRRSGRSVESGAALVLASSIAAFVFVDLFDAGGLSMAGWSLVLLAVALAGRRAGWPGAWVGATMLAVVLVFWLPDRLGGAVGEGTPFLTWNAIGDTLALVFMGLAVREIPGRPVRVAAGLLVWIAALWLVAREFTEEGVVTAVWSVFAVVLLASGRFGAIFRLVGMATVVLVVGKLLLFDLSRLDELVRVGLFAGFGAVLLLVSYFFPSWWKSTEETSPDPGAKPPDDAQATTLPDR